MNVSRFGFDAAPRPDDREAPRATDDPHVAMHAAPPDDSEDQRSEEPAEEPGYGHGV